MDLNIPDRDTATRIWLNDLAKSIGVLGKWKKLLLRCALDDAYYRGYGDGWGDAKKEKRA